MLKIMPPLRRARFLPIAVLSCLMAGPAQADSFPSWYAKARKAAARHDDDTALQAWSNALHLWKSTDSKRKKAQALAARAALYDKNGGWDDALKDLSESLKLETKDAVIFHQRGALYLEQGKISEAISDFYKATALKLDYSEAFFDRGRAYAAQGDAEFSKEDFRTACRLGFKKACDHIRTPKGSTKSKDMGVTSAPAGPAVQAPSAPPDFRSCIDRISSCSENGDSYSTCVSRARLCEKDQKQGCCPRGCVALFKKLLDTESEAAAFREVFTTRSACLPIKGR
jgi:hypothetical protein